MLAQLDTHMQKITRAPCAPRWWKEMKSLINYFSVIPKSSNVRSLPNPNDPFSKTISPSTVATVNAQAGSIVEKHDTMSTNKQSERGPYLHLTPAQKSKLAKEHETRVTKTLRYYAKSSA